MFCAVLPTTPPRTETVPFTADNDVIDLRPAAGQAWPERAHREPGLGDLEGDEAKPARRPGLRTELVGPGAETGAALNGVAPAAEESLQSASVATLVQKAKQGDPGAWEELVARFGGMIAATGRRYRLTPADVAELQQTTWLRLVENVHRIEQPERVGGWLATTARRESLQLLKRAAKYHSGADQMLANMPDRHLPEPDARPLAEERDTVLRAAWERLKPRCQQLLSLLMTDDPLGYKDLSQLLQMPVGSIGPTRARCLEHLRRLVEEEGMTGI
jgi:RNA polymerase sigma factor (sigma-70 family)